LAEVALFEIDLGFVKLVTCLVKSADMIFQELDILDWS